MEEESVVASLFSVKGIDNIPEPFHHLSHFPMIYNSTKRIKHFPEEEEVDDMGHPNLTALRLAL